MRSTELERERQIICPHGSCFLFFLFLGQDHLSISSFLPRERQYYLGGGVPLHPDVSYLTEQYKARPVGEPFPVTWYSFLNIPAGGPGLEGHRNSGLPESSVTLTAGNRRAGSQGPTGGEGLRGRPQLGQVLLRPLSAPPRAPDPNHRGPASGTPESGRGQLPGRAPGGPRGLSVCVTYVTESPDADPPTTARLLTGERLARSRRRPTPPPNPLGRGPSGAYVPTAPIGSHEAPARGAGRASRRRTRETTQ